MLNLLIEIEKAYHANAWHGNNALQVITAVKPENAFHYFIPNAHSIAELTLHLTSWTEEVTARLLGKTASEPAKGDWPIPDDLTVSSWEKIIFDFKIANDELIRICNSLSEEDWATPAKDERDEIQREHITFSQLVNGFIQHHAYHAGQIALLSKFNP